MNLHPRSYYDPVKQKQRRYDKMVKLLNLKPTDKVLNVGCGEGLTFEHFNKVNLIVGVDLFPESKIEQKNFKYRQIKGDGALHFKDKDFDAVFCIGVLEHIHPYEALEKTCKEIARVGKKFLIMVPDYNTLIEPHYAFPVFQKLPLKWQKMLHNNLNLRHGSHRRKENHFEEINYYLNKEWVSLFPGARYIIHKHIGILITNLIIWNC
jgi:SAM-dependent methyltransferase